MVSRTAGSTVCEQADEAQKGQQGASTTQANVSRPTAICGFAADEIASRVRVLRHANMTGFVHALQQQVVCGVPCVQAG
jgi:hypothetical protein